MDNPVNTLHLCLAHAVYEGFPEFEYQNWASNITMSRRLETHFGLESES